MWWETLKWKISHNLGDSICIVVVVVVVQALSRVQLFVTLWTAAHQASLSFTISQSLLKLVSAQSVMLISRINKQLHIYFIKIRKTTRGKTHWKKWPKYLSRHFTNYQGEETKRRCPDTYLPLACSPSLWAPSPLLTIAHRIPGPQGYLQ